ncbi:MAG: prephenate dehydrogenase [Chloroflexota bacterium]|nr:prephenate dehydrogenase [Chloroflexota bacterium]
MQVAIIGLGLIGGSIGLALKQKNAPGWKVVGYIRRPEVATTALKVGAIDRAEKTLKDTVKEADLVIIATPALTIREILSRIVDHLPDGCTVTDTASTKFQVMRLAHEMLPPRVNFIGGHPMAGKEFYGIEAAEAGLFQRCIYCLTPEEKTPPEALDKVINMVKMLGATPMLIDAQEHDGLVAGISHLPLLLSAALVSATTKDPSWHKMSPLAASGYYDLTRLASGNPQVNADICLSNSKAIIRWIDKLKQELDRYRELVSAEDENLQEALTEAREVRENWLNERK